MGTEEEPLRVEARAYGEVLLETYRYPPGPAGETPKHSHEKYQICLSLNFPGEYRYLGASHAVPADSLSVIHPGEAHSSRDPQDRRTGATYRVMYAEPALFEEAATEVFGSKTGLPSFGFPVFFDQDLARRFVGLHAAFESDVPRLERETRLLSVLAVLVGRHATTRSSPRPAGRERRAVRLVREYLSDNLAENVSLEELSGLANLSPYHLSRVFGAEVGLPPHAYHLQARLERAKGLLLRCWPIAAVAREVGFADQSHLGRHFKRLVGVTPGSYAENSKNVL